MNTTRNIQYQGITIYQSDFLPIDECFMACDIETKEEIKILTGGKIDLIQLPDHSHFIASKEIMDKFQLELNKKRTKDIHIVGKTTWLKRLILKFTKGI